MLPDWRKREDYTFTGDLSPEGWAWEFLRRNPVYREDYQALTDLLRELKQQYGSLDTLKARQQLQGAPLAYCFYPLRNEGESVSEWNGRCFEEGIKPQFFSVDVGAARQWGIIGKMPDPCSSSPVALRFETRPNWPRVVA